VAAIKTDSQVAARCSVWCMFQTRLGAEAVG